jgi:hypothetical protein
MEIVAEKSDPMMLLKEEKTMAEFENTVNTTEETVTTIEEDNREELLDAVNELAEDEENSETEPKMDLKSALKMGFGFAAGYAVGSTVQKVKNGKKHPEDLDEEPKQHFWNRLHFQSPIRLEKKDKPVENSNNSETENKEADTGKDQEKK